ncbi:MAG: NADH-quinone oxidoreductase subunit M [Bacteroidetes bacterium]|nr:NADH-quinone oxidoreductase subunit M [Bacteroidota bacterium]
MYSLLLILIPVVAGITTFFLKDEKTAKGFSLLGAIATLVISLLSLCNKTQLGYNADWIPNLNAHFSLSLDGVSKMLCLLNSISLPIIFISIYNSSYKNNNQFFALMLLMQAGIMGVFLANDALLFYFFWELALIPAYFLCSIWGGEKRIQVTFKFFIYTFVGSLLMLLGLIYLYLQTPGGHSFAYNDFLKLNLSLHQQNFVFALMFIAFAIKMPIFPFHTWQPDAYEQAPTPVTMVLSGVMVKMGIFAVIKWLLPIVPLGVKSHSNFVIILSVIGMIYASLIAIKQDDVKRLIAYSSIAHIGLMCAAIFTKSTQGMDGVLIQMFNHGINVIGLWIVADVVEKQVGTRKLSELGGLAHKAPILTILLVVMAFANIALPLTNAFVGEFLMFSGLFTFNIWFAAIALISIILGAVYTLSMVQKMFYGNTVLQTENAIDISLNIKIALIILVIMVLILGVYPTPIFNLIHS